MNGSERPWYQTFVLMTIAAVAGFLFLGNVLNAAANALTFVSPRVTFVGSAVLVAVIVGAQLLLIRRPLPWLVADAS
jgi:hypothetical protein